MWDGVLHQKYLEDLQKEMEVHTVRKKKLDETKNFNFKQMQENDHNKKETEQNILRTDQLQVNEDLHLYKKEQHRRKNLDLLRKKEIAHANAV